jgi:hypothetical protein
MPSVRDVTKRLTQLGQIRRPLTPDNDNQPLSSLTILEYAARLESQNGKPYFLDEGKQYIRVLRQDSSDPRDRSVVAFVNKHTGQVYRPDSARKRGPVLGFKLRV